MLVTLYLAVACPPNNYDVVLYHLPRQVQWLQQGSVQHFPCQDYRQTVNPPLAEYFSVHLMALSGSDRLQVLVSWLAYGLSLIMISQLVPKGKTIAVAAAAWVPMAIHEAASGKNDIVVAMWFLIAVWCLRTKKPVWLGVTLGLLVLTKGTGAIFGAPIGLIALWQLSWKRLALGLAIGAALNAPHVARNWLAYGSPAGQTFSLNNARHGPDVILSNVVRNVAMQMALPVRDWNHGLEQKVREFHKIFDIDPSGSASTWASTEWQVVYAPRQESANAPLHVLLIIIAILVLPFRPKHRLEMAILLLAGLLFCVVFKWQPWHPRLHLPLLMLGCVLIGSLFSKLPWLGLLIVIAMAFLGWPSLVHSEYRSLSAVHRGQALRYYGNSEIEAQTKQVASLITAGRVDLINHGAWPWEYPLTRELKRAHNRHVGFFYPVRGSPSCPAPEAVIAIGDRPSQVRHASGAVFVRTQVIGPYAIYEPGAALTGEPLDHPIGRFGIGAENP